MKRPALLIITTLLAITASAQTVFFTSSQQYTAAQLQAFYASVNIGDSLVIFNAPDYQLYAYDKTKGHMVWTRPLDRKSNTAPFFAGGYIWAWAREQVVKLDPATGNELRKLDAKTIETQPVVRNGILYFTGIQDGGSIIAYDLKADTVVWKRFIAHGSSKAPYYWPQKMVVNAEADQWIEFRYDGAFVSAGCGANADAFPSELPCVKRFIALTHDREEIKGKRAEKMRLTEAGPTAISTTAHQTFILQEGFLYALGNKLREKMSVELATLSDDLEYDRDLPLQLLSVTDDQVSILYNHQLLVYHLKDKKLVKRIDLSAWQPHQAILEGSRLWVISGKDGLLYGLQMD
ncbi:PQQ-binding-like beta-propeller repeat protein [Paraflavitalea sp. CAU 1676]|uniref:outer membrane protein assembly factor BamB family protein n=1 Tax=Paraflavitalea sp. CAU 1676 TaxID=3032598 RepID=UPI0023DA68C8|nr:PQQ-binding-like beta-propeller repeat protein [Paraflavitalea sp. CAU 1676]MDF2188360.1 PQQ-binding-like beta-propeller repeat protein [Paraflavitalea sp. CAU 1676]